jgi:hypothetical protein
MGFIRRHLKRFLTDLAGYLLILLGVAFGWVPGPGGIPLVIAGLGLLSINNEWAARLRTYLLKHGGSLVKRLFPAHPYVQWLYDIICLGLLALVTVLIWQHSPFWKVSLAVALFFLAVFIAAMNRDRYARIKHKS